MTTKLTMRTIGALKIPAGKDRVRFYDSELTGFGITVYSSGKRVFFVQYGKETQRVRINLGNMSIVSPEDARTRAMEILLKVAHGEDPLATRPGSGDQLTLASWIEEHLPRIEARRKSIRNDRRYLRIAEKRWGGQPLTSLSTRDIEDEFVKMSQRTPVDANRWLASLRSCLQAAWRADLIPSNPAMKIKPNPPGPPRERVFDDDEMDLLRTALIEEEEPVQLAFAMLIETGARLSEVLNAKWADVDLNDAIWRIPRNKSGKPQVMPLPASLVKRLRKADKPSEYLVAGRKRGEGEVAVFGPRADLKDPWARLVKKARLKDAHIHDLRRTFGLRIAKKAGIHVASRLLRHSDIRVTERHYAPLGVEDLRKVLE